MEGFPLVPGGWPRLEEIYVSRVDVCLFLPRQIELEAPIYPALRTLDLTRIPEPIDSLPFFCGLAQLPNLRHLGLWLVLFKKCAIPPVFPPLAFRLTHYTYMQKEEDVPDGTPSGWHIPIVGPSSSPKELSVLLQDVEYLSPIMDHQGCLDAVEELHLSDGTAWETASQYLPLEAYAGIARRCPRLKALRLLALTDSLLSGLAALLPDLRAPLRSVVLEFTSSQYPLPTRADLAGDDRAYAALLRAGPALRHLRSFSLLTSWDWYGSPGVEFPAIEAQCRSRAVVFEHVAR